MRNFLALSIFRSLCIAVILLAGYAHAEATRDVTVEQRVQRITEELRCVVCMNQTVADSHAELAILLKQQVRDMLMQGMSDQQAHDFMMRRYGDFVLYRTLPENTAWQLWLTSFLLLLLGWAFPLLKSRLARVLAVDESTSKAL